MNLYCVGMYRSASTWQYNVAARILEKRGRCQKLGFLPAKGVLEAQKTRACDEWMIVKTHDEDSDLARSLEEGRALALYSYRDLRDVALSLIHKVNDTFEAVIERGRWLRLCVTNHAFWTHQPAVLVQRYETITLQPLVAIREIAAHLGMRLDDHEVDALASEYSLENNRARVERFAAKLRNEGCDLSRNYNYTYEEESLMAWNHIRDGSTGAWRKAFTPRQIAILGLICGPWLIAEGYERDMAWAEDEMRHHVFDIYESVRHTADACEDEFKKVKQERLEIGAAAMDLAVQLAEYQAREKATWRSFFRSKLARIAG